MTTNADVELELTQGIPILLRKLGILPDGYQCEVHLHRGNRKKRRDAEFEANWDPDTDSIRIAFSPMEEEFETPGPPGTASVKAAHPPSPEDRLSDLVRALDRA